MDKELARHVARVAFKSSTEINDLIPFLKAFSSEEEYMSYVKYIASASASISTDLLQRVFLEHPDLEAEFEEKISKYGRYI
jgi:hypothetical protein